MQSFSHLDQQGAAAMVDVSGKAVTHREATATAVVHTRSDVIQKIEQALVSKGDVLATARIAGIMPAKKATVLIPLCHPLMLSKASVDFELHAAEGRIDVRARCVVSGQTGIEMEALTAVSVAALTLYDMCKALDPAMRITDIQLQEKSGGKQGTWTREAQA